GTALTTGLVDPLRWLARARAGAGRTGKRGVRSCAGEPAGLRSGSEPRAGRGVEDVDHPGKRSQRDAVAGPEAMALAERRGQAAAREARKDLRVGAGRLDDRDLAGNPGVVEREVFGPDTELHGLSRLSRHGRHRDAGAAFELHAGAV